MLQQCFQMGIVFVLFQLQQDTNGIEQKGFLDFLFSPCKCKCGVPNREDRTILRPHEFPWFSSIQLKNNEDQNTLPAVLINDRYVISAASPLVGLSSYDIKVTLGQFDRCFSDVSSSNISIEKIIIHPDFSVQSKENNLALLRFSRPITFDRRVSPICLSVPGYTYVGQIATVVGWFQVPTESTEVKVNCHPRKAGFPILDHKECIKVAKNPHDVTAERGCIGILGAHKIVCSDEPGGPVMYRSYSGVYELIGVLSGHSKCEQEDLSSALYTKINHHLSWITQNTKDACYCFKT